MREIPRRHIAPGDAMQRGRCLEQLTRQAFGQHLTPGRHRLILEPCRPAGERCPERGKWCLARRVMQQGTEFVHGVVPGRAVRQPVGGQVFVRGQYLFDPKDGRILQFRRALGGQGRQPPAQLAAIIARVGEAVDVIDPDAVDQAPGVKAKDGLVRRFEHVRHLDPDAGQAVHVEKATPVDFIRRRAPPGQAVALPLQQSMQPVAA